MKIEYRGGLFTLRTRHGNTELSYTSLSQAIEAAKKLVPDGAVIELPDGFSPPTDQVPQARPRTERMSVIKTERLMVAVPFLNGALPHATSYLDIEALKQLAEDVNMLARKLINLHTEPSPRNDRREAELEQLREIRDRWRAEE